MLPWFFIFLAVFLIGLTKSGFGSGTGLMVIPMTAIALGYIPERGSEAALGLLLPLLIVGDLISIFQYRKIFSMEIVKHLLPGTAVGVVLGALLLWSLHKQKEVVGALIRIEIGIECILLVGLHWWRQYRGMQSHLMREPWRTHLTGGFSAISSTLAHAAGPIIAMYLLPLKLDRRLFVGTCAIYFFILNTAKLPAYYFSHQFDRAELSFTMKFLPLLVLGAMVGFAINQRLSDKLFSRVVYIVTFVLGIYLLIDGAVVLIRHLRAA